MTEYRDRKEEIIKWSMETNTPLILHNGGAYEYSPRYDLFSFNPSDNEQSYLNGYVVVRDEAGVSKTLRIGGKEYDVLENCDDNVSSMMFKKYIVNDHYNNYFYKKEQNYEVFKFHSVDLSINELKCIDKNIVLQDFSDFTYKCEESNFDKKFKLFDPTLLRTYPQELINLYLVTKVNLG